MASADVGTGFDFGLVQRNAALAGALQPQQQGHAAGGVNPVALKARKTGTTICGVIFDDGVVLGADTRATEGPIVADKTCLKIHYIADNIRCCGAGTSADTENTTAMIASQLELHRMDTGRAPKTITAMTRLKQYLFQYQGHVSAALVLGGVDADGSKHLHTVYPHGSTDALPYVTMGSGSLAAMAVFEAGWKKSLSRQEAIDLVHKAISAGIFNDLGSGGSINICVVEKDSTEMLPRDAVNPRKFRREAPYEHKQAPEVVSETVRYLPKRAVAQEQEGEKAEGDAEMRD